MRFKLGLCFLVTRDPENMHVWREWLKKAGEGNVRVFSHISAKHIKGITARELREGRVSGCVPTKWGTISLVKAEAAIYREVLKDPSITHTVLVSETCIPVRSFSFMKRRLCADRKRGILNYHECDDSIFDAEESFTIAKGGAACQKRRDRVAETGLYTAEQWKVCSRSNMRDFVAMCNDAAYMNTFTSCVKVNPDSLAPDELMFATYLHRKYKKISKAVRHGVVTFTNFIIDAHPHTYSRLTKPTVALLRKKKTLFARKFKPLQLKTCVELW